MFVLDTNVASEFMRPTPTSAVTDWIADRDAQEMYLTAVNEAELRRGVEIMSVVDILPALNDGAFRAVWVSGEAL